MISRWKLRHFYVPGCISLLLVPFTFCWFAKPTLKQLNTHAITLVLFDTGRANRIAQALPKLQRNDPRLRRYRSFILKGKERDEADLDGIKHAIIELGNDSLRGVQIAFDPNASYGDFVTVIDQCRQVRSLSYMASGNSLWAF